MAGDWIKMRIDLQTHPKVFRMVSALQADRLRIIGGLHVAWSIFDTHSSDGVLVGYTVEAMDAVVGWPGFTQAMIDVEWAAVEDDGSLVMPRFDEHNGASAKRRANDAERKRNDRKNPVRNLSASDADSLRTREEKRREERARSKARCWRTGKAWKVRSTDCQARERVRQGLGRLVPIPQGNPQAPDRQEL